MTLKNILINASNITGAGAVSLTRSLLPPIVRSVPDSNFTILLPDGWRNDDISLEPNVSISYYPERQGMWNNMERIKQLYLHVPQEARKCEANVCLTLGDLPPVGMHCPHVVFLQQPLFVYRSDELEGNGWSSAKSAYMKMHLRRTIRSVDRIIVQTSVMAERLSTLYDVDPCKIAIIPQAVPSHVSTVDDNLTRSSIRAHPKPVKLIFLSGYYPHKNHAILPEVVFELRQRGLDRLVQIFTTIDLTQCASTRFKESLESCSDTITNLGTIEPNAVAALLRDSSALLFPTMVESFGLVYLEAMNAGLPILTSDRDFAHHMCGKIARYFDPLSAKSIAQSIEDFCHWKQPPNFDALAKSELARFPKDWAEVARSFLNVLKSVTHSDEFELQPEQRELTQVI